MSGGISQNHNYKPLFSFQDMHVSLDTKMLPGDLISNYKGKKKTIAKKPTGFCKLALYRSAHCIAKQDNYPCSHGLKKKKKPAF
jgi:hypothetical protein